MAISDEMKLHHIRVYYLKPDGPPDASNIRIQIDGRDVSGVVGFTYHIEPGGLPIVDMKLVAKVDIETAAMVGSNKPGQDHVQF